MTTGAHLQRPSQAQQQQQAEEQDLPAFDYTVDTTHGEEVAQDSAIGFCLAAFPEWQSVPAGECSVSKINGGISNLLLKVTPPASSNQPPVAVKVFGDKTELFINRSDEKKTLLALNKARFGPKVLAFFANGRAEEFMECKTLCAEEMAGQQYASKIARKLRHFHAVQADLPRDPTAFCYVRDFLGIVRKLQFDDKEQQQKFAVLDLGWMDKQIEELQHVCERIKSPIVFCHNDLLAGNIVVRQEPDFIAQGEDAQLQFIDFEYGAYSYRGFDFGNHFNEYAGFECDYSRYPKHEQKHAFLRSYLNAEGLPVSEDDILDAIAEADLFALVSHMYWAIWALIQARYSTIEFDYFDYSRLRWIEYKKRKDAYIRAAKERFNL